MLKDSIMPRNLDRTWLDIPHASWDFSIVWFGCPRWLIHRTSNLILAIGWNLSWGSVKLYRLHMASPYGLPSSQHGSLMVVKILTWPLRGQVQVNQQKRWKLHDFLWPNLGYYTASLLLYSVKVVTSSPRFKEKDRPYL